MENDLDKGKLLTFGQAIKALKQGEKVARSGWNGKGMYLALQIGSVVPVSSCRAGAALARASEKDGIKYVRINDHIDMRAADGSIVVGWVASQTDMLSEDWYIVVKM